MSQETSLTVSKLIRAPRAKVFAAWTTPEIMDRWFCPKDLALVDSGGDVRVGGQFHATMEGGGARHTVRGVYKEIVPNERLVFSHRWDEPQAVDTLVSVEFSERDGGTLVTLTHTRLRNAESAKGHEQGWNSTLESLEEYFSTQVAG